MIRNLLLASVALATISGTAFAADLPSRAAPAPYLPPPPVWTWTGFYIGINGGYGGDRMDYGSPIGSTKVTSSGFLGGGQIGYNWQFPTSQFVLGAEVDFQGSSIRASTESFGVGGATAGLGTKLEWFGTARGRIGYAFGQFMPYVTGGFAYGRLTDYAYASGVGGGSFSAGGTHTGWTAGAGLEYAITKNLTFKTEYDYMQLGRTAYTTSFQNITGFTTGTKPTVHMVRAGLNWKFDFLAPPVPAPVVAKY